MEIYKLLNPEKLNEEIYKIKQNEIKYKDVMKRFNKGHLNWKEKRREKALVRKSLRIGLTKDERKELNDLNYVKVITEGQTIPQIRKLENNTWITVHDNKLYNPVPNRKRKAKNEEKYSRKRIQTRSMTRKYEEEIKEAIKESLKQTRLQNEDVLFK